MAHIYADRVKETASNKPNASTAFNLPDTGATGYRSFDSVLASTDTCIYGAENNTDWEVGVGTFTAGSPDTLTRTTILSSSTGSAIDWSAGGDVSVYITADARAMTALENMRNRDLTSFRVEGDETNAQTINDTTLTTITGNTSTGVFRTVAWGPTAWWDADTGVITPTLAGTYIIGGAMTLISSANDVGDLLAGAIYKNDNVTGSVSLGTIHVARASNGVGIIPAGIMQLNGTTDNIRMKVYLDLVTDASRATLASARHVNLWLAWIGS